MESRSEGRQTPLSNIRLSGLIAESAALEDRQQEILEFNLLQRGKPEEFNSTLFSKLKSDILSTLVGSPHDRC
jgi:hypothetical protein